MKELWNLLIALLINYGALVVYMMNVPRILHYAQLEGYHNGDFFRWVTKNPKLAFKPDLKQAIGTLIVFILYTALNYWIVTTKIVTNANAIMIAEMFTLLLVYMIPNIIKAFREKKKRKQAKKPLVYTARAKRLMFWSFFTAVLLESTFLSTFQNFLLKPLFYSLLTFAGPVNMVIAIFLSSPTETMIKNSYICKAKWKLWKKDYKKLIKIGITGSYRKNQYQVYFGNDFE